MKDILCDKYSFPRATLSYPHYYIYHLSCLCNCYTLDQMLYAKFYLTRFFAIQLVQRNANQGFRYMQNSRNGMDPAMIPQGLMGPMIPVPLDAGSMQFGPMDAGRSPLIPTSALASALASASPDQQRMV